jgi:hypothetical protein
LNAHLTETPDGATFFVFRELSKALRARWLSVLIGRPSPAPCARCRTSNANWPTVRSRRAARRRAQRGGVEFSLGRHGEFRPLWPKTAENAPTLGAAGSTLGR